MKTVHKSQLFLILIILLSNINFYYSIRQSSWDYIKGGADWTEECKKGEQAPIDISQPFQFKEMNLTFLYTNMMTEYSFYNDGNNLILEGDYGYMTYNNQIYFTSHIQFYSPSLHTFSNKHLPLEMQIIHHDADGNTLTISVLFKYSEKDYSIFLGKLGFDKEDLQRQSPLDPVTIKEQIDLSKYIHQGKDFFIYEGKEWQPPCEKETTYLIMTDVLKVSKKQLNNFPQIVKNKNRIIQLRNDRKIYTTFRMEDVEKKQAEIKMKVDAMKKIKEEEMKMKQVQADKENKNSQNLQNLQNITQNINNMTEIILNKYNITANETSQDYQDILREIERIKNKNNHTHSNITNSTNDNCEMRDMIPFDVVADKAKAYEDYIKSSDPKFLGNSPDLNQSLIIDKDLPKSESEIKRISLEEKYEQWKKLYEMSTQDSNSVKDVNSQVFIQMKSLESELKINNYKPFMNRYQNFNNEAFLSFIQLESKSKFTDKEYLDEILNSDVNDVDKILNDFINTSVKASQEQARINELKHIEEIKQEIREENIKKNTNENINKNLNVNPMKAITDKVDNKNIKTVSVFKTEGVVDKNGIVDDLSKIENGQRVIVTKNEDLTLNIDAKVNSPFKNKKEVFNQILNENIENNQQDLQMTIPMKKINSEIVQDRIDEIIDGNLIKTDDNKNAIEPIINGKVITLEKVIPVEVIPIVKVIPVQVVQEIDVKVTAPLPNKSINIPETIVNDKITQLEKNLYEEKLAKYIHLKETFNKSVFSTVNNIETLSRSNELPKEDLNIDNSNKLEYKNNIQLENNKINLKNQNSEEKQNYHENVVKFENMRNVAEVLSKSYDDKNKKINPGKNNKNLRKYENHNQQKSSSLPVEEVFDTNTDYDKKIFNLIQIVLSNLIGELKQLDQINQRIYDQNSINSFITEQGLIRITIKNLSTLIRKSFNSDLDQNLSFDEKLNSVYNFISKTIISQNQEIKDNHNYYDLNLIEAEDINKIIDNILLQNDFNQYELENVDKQKMSNLVIKILQKLPIILIRRLNNEEDKNDTENLSDKDLEKKLRENFESEDVFITEKSAGKIKQEMQILGPKIKEKMESQLNPQPGEGRKAVSKDGTIDKTEIFNTSTWPSSCKIGDQSPVNINKPYQPEETNLTINLESPKGKITLQNDGFKLLFTADSFGWIKHGVHQFMAKQIEIHHPSEHTFGDDEARSPLEIQIVCQDIFGNTAAIAILFKLEEENLFLKTLGFGVDNPLFALKLRNSEIIEFDENTFSDNLNLGPFVNNTQHYVTYIGSLTSPPCTQNVQWFVLLQKLGVSETQLEYFPVLFGREFNVRGLQSLNNRKLKII